MAADNSIISLLDVIYQPNADLELNRDYIKVLLKENTPVLCINNSTGKKRYMPFKTLYDDNNSFWQQVGNWEYFLTKDEFINVQGRAAAKPAVKETKTGVKEEGENPKAKPQVETGYGKEAETFLTMTLTEKVNKIEENKKRLNELIVKKVKDPKIVTWVLVEAAKNAAIINHAALMDAMVLADGEARKITKDLVDSTCEMVKLSTQLITEDLFNDELMRLLAEKSDGTIVQHMIRVYINSVAFLSFYNRLISASSSTINRLRISFAEKYRNYYYLLLPHIPKDDFHLERVFFKGMMAVPPELFSAWAVGFLLHDTGKAAGVEYHEGEAAYNREVAVEHVKLGYTSMMNKTIYPREACLITGYHHEYYGNNSGYGYFRAYLEQYKKLYPTIKQDFCITYELAPMLDYVALAYFPAKVLEIIDIYDNVTDPNRKNSAVSDEEALAIMREENIVKHRRLDPILFDLFEAFVRRKQKT